jgi:predicted nucleotide-binding protein
MNKSIADLLAKFCMKGDKLESIALVDRWSGQVSAFLKTAVGPSESDEFIRLFASNSYDQHALRLGHLQGLIARAEAQVIEALPQASNAPVAGALAQGFSPRHDSKKVFIVHGHDNEAKEGTARFLEKLGLQLIVLHEQPNFGRTIIEKFETYSGDIVFAVVLLTPDDFGGIESAPETRKPRARQNVIMELGYFMGRLGRFRVCALHKGGVELPSDYQGVLYIELDPYGAWKTKLAKEFEHAKLPIDLTGLLSG